MKEFIKWYWQGTRRLYSVLLHSITLSMLIYLNTTDNYFDPPWSKWASIVFVQLILTIYWVKTIQYYKKNET